MSSPARRSSVLLFLVKYPLFILIGVAIGVFVTWRSAAPVTSFTVFSPPSEASRPALKVRLAPALKAFFDAPDNRFYETVQAVENYRRSFADATQHDLTDPALTTCHVPLECTRMRQQQDNAVAGIITSFSRKLAPLPLHSAEVQAATFEALTLDRTIPMPDIRDRLSDYRDRHAGEATLLKMQEPFFRLIDEITATAGRLPEEKLQILHQYFDKYADLSSRSFRPIHIRCGQRTPYSQDKVDPAPCLAAIAGYQSATRSLTGPGSPALWQARATHLKKLIADRLADRQYMKEELDRIRSTSY
jgi:hypothetical protein